MTVESERLEFWKQVAQIASALAIPVVLAIMGYYVQRSLSDAGLKKDYVQMALTVLKDQPSKENEQLRQWAIAILDKNSPVPIPSSLKAQLVTSKPFEVAFLGKDDLKFEETVECRPAPNVQTLEWLLANYPSRFTRCPNGQIGERSIKFPNLFRSAASGASSSPSK